MGNPIDKYRQNAVLEGAGAGSGYKSEGYKVPRTKSSNPDDEALKTLSVGFGVPLAVSGVGAALSKRYKGGDDQEAREAADEIKREKRGVEKTPTDYARDDAREIKMQEQTDKAADMASKNMAKGGTASSRADGCCVKGKTRGKVC